MLTDLQVKDMRLVNESTTNCIVRIRMTNGTRDKCGRYIPL